MLESHKIIRVLQVAMCPIVFFYYYFMCEVGREEYS